MNGGRKLHASDRAVLDNLRVQWTQALRTGLDEGRLVPTSDLQARRSLTSSELQLAEKEHRIFSLADANEVPYYPAFFCGAKLAEVTELVSQRLGGIVALEKWAFFTTATHCLGNRTPLEALENGDLNLVLQAVDAMMSRRGLLGKTRLQPAAA